jgi:hypothetical protein
MEEDAWLRREAWAGVGFPQVGIANESDQVT